LSEFKKWFAESKVVDKNGAPMIVYHGTRMNFDAFDLSFLGSSIKNPTTCFGFFFTEDREDALYWANRSKKPFPPKILSVYLSIKNPKVIPAIKFRYYLKLDSTIKQDLEEWKKDGFDGIETWRLEKHWFAVFNPNQVRIKKD